MKHLLSTIIFLFAVILKGNAESYSFPSPNEINSVINLDLKGIFSSTHTKSLPLTPVEASLVDNTLLNISFVVHSGEVTVRILSEKGILYSSCTSKELCFCSLFNCSSFSTCNLESLNSANNLGYLCVLYERKA